MRYDFCTQYELDPIGEIELIDHMGDDQAIVDAARVSVQGASKLSGKESLIRYLMRHRHTTPFEMAAIKVRVKLPIFVIRQWHRHRTLSYNEVSARYSTLPDEFWHPEEEQGVPWRGQHPSRMQCSNDGTVEYDPSRWYIEGARLGMVEEAAFEEYHKRLEAGVSREMARSCLPMSTMTSMYCMGNLHNILHFIGLRTHKHAQPEIRVYAEKLELFVQNLFPITYIAWNDYVRNALTLSAPEVRMLNGEVVRMGVGEAEEAAEKLARINYHVRAMSDQHPNDRVAVCDKMTAKPAV